MRRYVLLLLVFQCFALRCLVTMEVSSYDSPSQYSMRVNHYSKGSRLNCDSGNVSGYVKLSDKNEFVLASAIRFLGEASSSAASILNKLAAAAPSQKQGRMTEQNEATTKHQNNEQILYSDTHSASSNKQPISSTQFAAMRKDRTKWPQFTNKFSTTGNEIKYYLQNDPRWGSIPYTIHNDNRQTISSSGCGPTCAAMAVSTLTGLNETPFSAAQFALLHGDRTYNMGTAFDFFCDYYRSFGLKCQETKNLDVVLKYVDKPGHLAVASVGAGFWTHTGHYVLIYARDQEFVYAKDPLHPNKRKQPITQMKNEGLMYFVVSQS